MTFKKEDRDTLALYLKEVRKHSILSREEEVELAEKINWEMAQLRLQLLDIPIVWTFLLGKFKWLKNQNRAISKMSSRYGDKGVTIKELTEPIEDCMCFVGNTLSGKTYSSITMDKRIELTRRIFEADLSHSLYVGMVPRLEELIDLSHTKSQVGLLKNEFRRKFYELKKTEERFVENRNKLVMGNLRLVLSFAIKYQHLGIPIEDLVQEGNLALHKAVEKFDPRREFKFSTYASWWIRQSFIKIFRTQGRTVRLPSHIHELAAKINKMIADVERDENRVMGMREIADKVDVDIEVVEKINEMYADPISLETDISSGRATSQVKTLKDFLMAESEHPVETISGNEILYDLKEALKKLDDKQKKVITYRFGLNSERTRTLDEIAQLINENSREAVRLIEVGAMEKLREILGVGR